jgi:hypothetical protein
MARIVYVPELGRSFSFRDGATDQEVDSFFKGAFPTPPSVGVVPDVAPSSTPTGPDESGVLGRFAYGLGTGITDIPGGIASLFYPAEEAAQTSAGQFSEEARKYLEETLGIDPTKDPTAAQQAAQALGSVASFLIPGGAVAKGAGLAGKTAATAGRLGTVTAGAQGVALGAEARSERIRQQLASGMQISEEQQLASQRMSGLIGAAEAYPLAKFFGPLQQLLSKVPLSQAPALNKIVQSRLGRITRAGLEEGAQEAASGIANDIMELGIYNPDVQIGQDILSNAGTGAFAGSFVEGIIQLAAGRKLRPYKQLQQDLLNESRQNTERVRLGQIAQAAEDLRQSGVQGEVNIEEDEFDGLPVFNIKSPDGKVITQFNDRGGRAEDSAIAAVNLYSNNTGIKIKPNVIKKTPEVSAEADEEFVDDPDVEVKEPPVPPGMTRVYHSGSRGEGETGRFVSTSKQYASDYRKDLPLFYTDLPADDPRVSPDEFNPEQTVDQGFTFNFDLQPEEAVTLRRVKRDEKEVPEAIPETAPIGAVEQPAEGISALEDIIQQPSTQQVNEAGEPVAPAEPTVAVPPEGKPVADVITPRSLREAYMNGPKIAVPTSEVADRFQKIYESLINRLSVIAPSDVTVGLRDFIETENPDVLIKGMHRVDKSGGQTKNIIDLATGIYGPDMTIDEMVNNLLDVLNHEVIHAIRRNGLIRPAEWKILSRAVTEAKMPGKKYTYLDKAQAIYKPSLDPVYADPDVVIEEAVAELYKDWVRNGKKPVKGFGQTQGLLNRITEFFRRIFRVLRDNNYDEVFKAIESGEVRGRPLDPSSRAGVRLSAGVIDERRDGRDGEGSYAGGKLAPLDGAPKGAGQLGPDPSLVAVAERYAAQNGINLKRQGEYVQVNEELARSIADAYDKMPHAPQDPAVKEAYADLIRQTKAQYDALIDDGYVFTFFDSNSDPYGGNPWNAMRDLRANKRMAVYGTYDGYGTEGITGAAVDDNPMLADTGLKWIDQSGVLRPVTANDLFRAVHDAFGHGLEGAGFRARGEENAWRAHVRLFTGPAVGAITSETRGQNSWLNFGPYGEKNLKALLEDAVFAEQKTGLMPSWTWEEGRARDFDEGPRFSAAPLSPYLQSQNQNLFTEPPRLSFVEKIFDYLFGYTPASKERMRVAVRANIVDKTAFVTYLEKQLNLRDNNVFDRYVADYSATAALTQRRRASHLTSSTIMMGNPKVNFADPGNIMSATIKVEESPDSILKIAEILTAQGPIDPATGSPQDLSDVFKTYATAIRGRDLRAKGLQVPRYITPQYVNEALTTIPRDYPQVVEAYNMYQRYNKRLMEAARDSGLFSDAEFARLTRDSNYYSFYRELYQEELSPTATTKTAGEFKFREYKGSEAGGLINDPLYVMIRNSQFLIESMAKNLATVKSFDVSRRMGEAQLLARGQDPDISQGFQKDVMYFKDKGVLKRFAVKDPLLVTALGSDDRVVLGKAFDLLGMPADILRETVTRDPAFMVANLLRDTVSSWITSGEDIKPFIGTAKGVVSALKQSSSLKDLMGRGVVGSYDMAMMEPTDIANTLRRRTLPKNIHMVTSVNGAVGGARALWDFLGQASEVSDAATRIAVYDAARAQGLSEAEAALRAVEIMDFSRRGASTLLNILTKTVPFLNARIQGLDVLYQSMAAGKRFIMGQSLGERDANLGKKFLVRGTMLAALSIALEMYNNDDEDYEQLDSYIKDSNLLIPLKAFGLPGEFIAIPKPFEAGLIFSTFPQMLYKYFVSGDASNRDAANLFFSQFASTFGINPMPQILIPPLEVIMNHDFYTGLPLISEGKMRLDPSLQYDSRTSTIARMINNIPFIYDVNTGEFRGPSPIAVDQIISGYSGPIGSYIVMAVGAAMSGFDAGPEKIPMEISQYPVIRRFFVDAEAKNPAVVTQAYELFRLVDEANRTFSRLRQANDAEALMDYFEEKKDVLAYKKHIFKMVDRLNKLSAYERQIERDKTMTDEEKIAAKRRLREMRIRVAATVEEINKKLGR